MIEQLHSLRYLPEKDLKKEGLRKVGVGLFIVDLNSSKIWVVQENKGKNGNQGTGREKGDLTIPLETRKSGESISDNTLGGLAEFRQLCMDEELIWLDGASYVGRQELVPGVAADLIILGLRNRCTDEVSAVNNDEVTPVGWMTLEELRSKDQIRKGVAKFLDFAIQNRLIEEFIAAAQQSSQRERKINSSTNLDEMYQNRELLRDIGET